MTTEDTVTIEPAAATAGGTPAAGHRPGPRVVRYVLDIFKRYWATTALVLTILIVGLSTGAFWNQVTEDTTLFDDVAYGLPALQDGKWWTYVTGMFFAPRLDPVPADRVRAGARGVGVRAARRPRAGPRRRRRRPGPRRPADIAVPVDLRRQRLDVGPGAEHGPRPRHLGRWVRPARRPDRRDATGVAPTDPHRHRRLPVRDGPQRRPPLGRRALRRLRPRRVRRSVPARPPPEEAAGPVRHAAASAPASP